MGEKSQLASDELLALFGSICGTLIAMGRLSVDTVQAFLDLLPIEGANMMKSLSALIESSNN